VPSIDNTERRGFGSAIEYLAKETSREEAQKLIVRALLINQG